MRHTTITPDRQIALDEALRIAQQRHIVIVPTARSIKLWSPCVQVPGPVRVAIMANRKQVKRLIGQSHMLVCPSPELHRASWAYINRRWCCDVCARLAPWMDGKSAK
jgi:hypothetical protein